MSADAPTLFDAPATRGASRASDPSTSRDAARSMGGHILRDQQRQVLCAVVDVCRHHDGATAYEVWQQLDGAVKENVIGKRLGELRERGMVRLTSAHRPGSSHRMQQVHALTEAARDLLAGAA